jgi:Zn finger protein HypA/HybF involved in hydrogenase expression
MIGTPVKCKNCGLKWIRITPMDNPGGVVLNDDLQYYCPKCSSNWYEFIPEVLEEGING